MGGDEEHYLDSGWNYFKGDGRVIDDGCVDLQTLRSFFQGTSRETNFDIFEISGS